MASNSQWPKCAEVATVLESDQTEGNDDQKNGFLVHMPAEEEGCISAESQSSYKYLPVGTCVEPKLHKRNLCWISI